MSLQVTRRPGQIAAQASRPSNTPDDTTVDVDGIVKDLQDKVWRRANVVFSFAAIYTKKSLADSTSCMYDTDSTLCL